MEFSSLKVNSNGNVTVAVVGKTGDGKSSTLNTIISTSKSNVQPFVAKGGVNSDTKVCDERQVDIYGLKCRLIDTMGLFDTEITDQQKRDISILDVPDLLDDHKVVLIEPAKVVQICNEGVDAFLFVMNGAARFTKEERDTLDIIVRFFGTSMLEHCIFLLTNKDRHDFSLEACRDAVRKHLTTMNVLNPRDDQFVAFDNVSKPTKTDQVTELFASIESVVTHCNGHPYTNVMFRLANATVAAELQKLKAAREAELAAEVKRKEDEIKKAQQRLKEETERKEREHKAKLEEERRQQQLQREANAKAVAAQIEQQRKAKERLEQQRIEAIAQGERQAELERQKVQREIEAAQAAAALRQQEEAARISALQAQLEQARMQTRVETRVCDGGPCNVQ